MAHKDWYNENMERKKLIQKPKFGADADIYMTQKYIKFWWFYNIIADPDLNMSLCSM